MSKFVIVVIILFGLAGGIFYLTSREDTNKSLSNLALRTQQAIEQTKNSTPSGSTSNADRMQVIAEGLDTPWGLAQLPDGSWLVTERKGTVRLVNASGQLQASPVATIAGVREIGEGGLLGIAVSPSFSTDNLVYFYYTYSQAGDNTLNRVVKLSYLNNQLTNEQMVVNAIPGASNHDGGRIKFGADGYLYIGTGDAQEPSLAQNSSSLAGKILRVKDGSQAEVYSLGHRNVQGLTWDKDGNLWATEHGRSGALSGLDELNLIKQGKNYGWPDIQGNETRSGMEVPNRNSGNTTWAPAGAAYLNGSIYFAGLRGQALYQATVSGASVIDFKEHFRGELGRIRDVVVGSDNMLYISTSNLDGRGTPKDGDDKIIRVNPDKL